MDMFDRRIWTIESIRASAMRELSMIQAVSVPHMEQEDRKTVIGKLNEIVSGKVFDPKPKDDYLKNIRMFQRATKKVPVE